MSKKKTNRIISLVLALTMIFTFMAMSASAATTEVQPRASICPQCGGYGFVLWKIVYKDTAHYYNYPTCSRGGCTNGPATHVHFLLDADLYNRCATCGYSEMYEGTSAYCPNRDA